MKRMVSVALLNKASIMVFLTVAVCSAHGQTSVERLETITNHLRLIDSSKDQVAARDGRSVGDVPTQAEVGKYIRDGFPKCPVGGRYIINPIGTEPAVSLPLRALMPITCDLRDNYSVIEPGSKQDTPPTPPKPKPTATRGPLPQAQPVIQQFKAVIQGDVEQLRDSYSQQLQERITNKYTWDEVLVIYRDAMTKSHGDCSVEDFSFSYRESDATHGSVRIAFKGTPIQGGTKRVVLENGSWKVNEK
jgi:hypothetical protein